MKKFRLALKGSDTPLILNIPGFGELTKSQRLLEFAYYLKKTLFLVLLFLLPVSPFILRDNISVGFETSVFTIMLAGLLVLIGLFALIVSLHGSKLFVDSTGLIIVLLFALLTTSAAVAIVPPDSENTFGVVAIGVRDALKTLSGLAIISYVAFYFLTNSIVRTRSFLEKSINAVSLGFLTLNLLALIDNQFAQYQVLFIAALPFLAYQVVRKSRLALAYFVALIANVSFLIGFNFTEQFVFVAFVAAFVASLPISYLLFSYHDQTLLKQFSNFAAGIEKLRNDFSNGVFNFNSIGDFALVIAKMLLIFVSPILSFLVIFMVANSDGALISEFRLALNYIQDAWAEINESVFRALVGLGTSEVSRRPSLIASILRGQGLIGIAAYLLLFGYSYYLVLKTIVATKAKGNNLLKKVAFGFLILFVPVFSLFVYIEYILFVLWWFALTVFTVLANISTGKVGVNNFYVIEKLSILERFGLQKYGVHLRIFFGLTLLLISYILIYVLVTLTGELI